MPGKEQPLESAREFLAGKGQADDLQNLPPIARKRQGRNFFLHAASLAGTKSGDRLLDPKLVLSGLLSALGAPIFLIGLLVPVRESLALLPQLVTAPWIHRLRKRKYVWATGSAVQGLAVLGMALAAFTLTGSRAGWTIVGLLAVFALARSACSTSYKDVLGRTVVKANRGAVTGFAASWAAAVALLFGVSVMFEWIPVTVFSIGTVLVVAGALWLCAAGLFTALAEDASKEADDDGEEVTFLTQLELLRTDPQLRLFIAARGLLTVTALAPPYVVVLSGGDKGSLGNLGPFVIASALAGMMSSYVWGRLSDRSSRQTLILSSLAAGLSLALMGGIGLWATDWMRLAWVGPSLFFCLMIAYQGIRVSRSTHIVDMAGNKNRASYAALSNTAIGVILLLGGIFGWIASVWGNGFALILFSVCSFAGSGFACALREVQKGE